MESISFLQVQPAIPLRSFIKQYNYYGKPPEPYTLRPLPNGYIEAFFHLHENALLFKKSKDLPWEKHKGYIVGVHNLEKENYVQTTNPKNYFVFTVIFYASGVKKLLGIPIAELTNQVIDIELILGNEYHLLLEQLEKAKNQNQVFSLLNGFFLNRLRHSEFYDKNDFYNLIQHSTERTVPVNVQYLSKVANYNTRSLQRHFKKELGLTPKDFIRIIRFNRVCKFIQKHPFINMNDVINIGDYYDQAHFINEFKNIVHYSPVNYLKKRPGIIFLNRPYIIPEKFNKV